MKSVVLFVMAAVVFSGLVISGCNTENVPDNPVNTTTGVAKDNQLQVELARVRAATAKYQDINRAIADGYADINLYIPMMGWHYLNASLLDSTFELDKPELLVYINKPDGGFKLAAVEYAIPDSLPAPEGFTGSEDEWIINQQFHLWTLHAWVWYNNPNGIFAPMNPRVP